MGRYKIHEESWQGRKKEVFQKQFRNDATGNVLRVTYTEAEEELMPSGDVGCGEIDLYLLEKRNGPRKSVVHEEGGTGYWRLYTDVVSRSHNDVYHRISIREGPDQEVMELDFHKALVDNVPEMLRDPEVKDSLDRASYSRPIDRSSFL